MARTRDRRVEQIAVTDRVLDAPESTLLDVIDHLLNKGVMATGDLTLGVAGVDLIYLGCRRCCAPRIV